MEDDIPYRAKIESIRVHRQLNAPAADSTCPLERQIALVTEIKLEEPAVLARRARHDRLGTADVLVEVIGTAIVFRVPVLANTAEGLGERAVHVCVRTHDTRNR